MSRLHGETLIDLCKNNRTARKENNHDIRPQLLNKVPQDYVTNNFLKDPQQFSNLQE
jgi:hypothetical protein